MSKSTDSVPKSVKSKLPKLTKKQRGFVNDYADTGNGSFSAKKNYDVSTDLTARSIASENLTKPNIQEALRELGFDSNNAKRVISEILNDETNEPKDRIKAAENIFKVHGDYAPEKSIQINAQFNIENKQQVEGIASKVLEQMKNEEIV